MTPEELREALKTRGIKKDYEFERVLNILIEHMLELTDVPINDFKDEELAFAVGFMLGAASSNLMMGEMWKRMMN